MAHVKIDVSIKNVDGPIQVESFELHVDTQYSSDEVIAVMGALPEYMAGLIKLVDTSKS
jgi:hypothetical protein